MTSVTANELLTLVLVLMSAYYTSCAKLPSECLQPPDKGPCHRFRKVWYFNSRSSRCEKLKYGGCGGNENRFGTLQACKKRCATIFRLTGGCQACNQSTSFCVQKQTIFSCLCRPGFSAGSDGICQDMDECATHQAKCERGAICINTFGSYECRCPVGFRPDGERCIKLPYSRPPLITTTTSPRDFRTGVEGMVCGPYEVFHPCGGNCQLTCDRFGRPNGCNSVPVCFPGCICRPGLVRYGPACIPWQHCPPPVTAFPDAAVVIAPIEPATPKPPVRGEAIPYEPFYRCQDCHRFAFCVSGRCRCGPGFVGDGHVCRRKSIQGPQPVAQACQNCHEAAKCTPDGRCQCRLGYTGDGQTCTDIDECFLGSARCHPYANCANVAGGYYCQCRSGFAGSGYQCTRNTRVCQHDFDPVYKTLCTPGMAKVTNFVYNSIVGRCMAFTYGGCEAMAQNIFPDEMTCRNFCSQPPRVLSPYRSHGTAQRGSPCVEPKDAGTCEKRIPMFYYDVYARSCKIFAYSGCGGSRNIFTSFDICMKTCSGVSMLTNGTVTGITSEEREYLEQHPHQPDNNDHSSVDWPDIIVDPDPNSTPQENSEIDLESDDAAVNDPRQSSAIIVNSICQLEIDPGFGASYPVCATSAGFRFGFAVASGACRSFAYDGCGGNANRFFTLESCQQFCLPTLLPSAPACSFDYHYYRTDLPEPEYNVGVYNYQNPWNQPSSSSGCQNAAQWFYPNQNGGCRNIGKCCQWPLYESADSGCRHYPEYEVSTPGPGHAEPEDSEPSEAEEEPDASFIDVETYVPNFRIIFREPQKKLDSCLENKFSTYKGQPLECKQPVDAGYGHKDPYCNRTAGYHYYFDAPGLKRCIAFMFLGCGGNGNRFRTETECAFKCVAEPAKEVPGESAVASSETAVFTSVTACFQPLESGACVPIPAASGIRYFYDSSNGQRICRPFLYDGCSSSLNRFNDTMECQETCGGLRKPKSKQCMYWPERGPCFIIKKAWFYNLTSGQCERFTYGGCGGNDNNFQTQDICRITCVNDENGVKEPQQKDESKEVKENELPESKSNKADCLEMPIRGGDCPNFGRIFFFDKSMGKCRESTGCRDTKNAFSSLIECESVCKDADVTSGQDGPAAITGDKLKKSSRFESKLAITNSNNQPADNTAGPETIPAGDSRELQYLKDDPPVDSTELMLEKQLRRLEEAVSLERLKDESDVTNIASGDIRNTLETRGRSLVHKQCFTHKQLQAMTPDADASHSLPFTLSGSQCVAFKFYTLPSPNQRHRSPKSPAGDETFVNLTAFAKYILRFHLCLFQDDEPPRNCLSRTAVFPVDTNTGTASDSNGVCQLLSPSLKPFPDDNGELIPVHDINDDSSNLYVWHFFVEPVRSAAMSAIWLEESMISRHGQRTDVLMRQHDGSCLEVHVLARCSGAC